MQHTITSLEKELKETKAKISQALDGVISRSSVHNRPVAMNSSLL